METTHNIFISHYGKDDEHVQRLKNRLKERGYHVRNSSVDSTKYQDHRPSNHFISKRLRMLVKWAGTFICLIGENTHSRPWVNYEIRQAHRQGKPIVGIYKYGCNQNVELPSEYKKYGTIPYGWNSVDRIGDILEGKEDPVDISAQASALPMYSAVRIKCN